MSAPATTGRLELSNVTAGYDGTTVLRNVDLVAPAGRVTALIGPNGAGKTTLLRTASGLLPPSEGAVTLDGHDVTRASSHQLVARGVCHVPEGRAIFPSLTVKENLLLHDRGAFDDPLDRAADAFPRLGERMHQTAGTMSGGEQQMLALARAYIANPRYVLLDEVSMGLAPKVVHAIFEFLERLAADGAALLIVEQYVHQVLAMADLVYVLNRGRVTFAGQPSEIDADALAEEYLGVGAH
jgi:branched-chain amino acid transport system ATP-binding protein